MADAAKRAFERALTVADIVREHKSTIVEEARELISLIVRVDEGAACVSALIIECRSLLLDLCEEAVDMQSQGVVRADA